MNRDIEVQSVDIPTIHPPDSHQWFSDEDPTTPQVFSIRLARQAVKCRRYDFELPAWIAKLPRAGNAADQVATSTSDAVQQRPANAARRKSATRIRPPEDVIKLKDRLLYVLQPALETLLHTGVLQVPFEPFAYQLQGISFLYPRQTAVLADEMGLGKTMQAITTMRLLLHAREVQSVLLICPKPLISNWQRELAQWAPELPVTVVRGNTEQRRWSWSRSEFPVKIVNYESVVRDVDLVEEGIVSADLVILDEAQRVKNSRSTTSEVIRQIDRRRSWALTGTPIENSTDDLVGVFEFLMPGLLTRGLPVRDMAQLTSDYILRRTKDQVLTDLPPKLFRDELLELSPDQQARYETAENEGVVRLAEMDQQITIQHVFELVLRLKQICNFDPVTGRSSKMDQLKAEMEEVAACGHKAIVFSQWVDTLQRLGDELAEYQPLQYHGRMSSAAREQAIHDFREQPEHSVLLISYGAGSVGLNLQFSRYVFLFDRWWNPAVEDQAINRAHRIGSAGSVTITRFLTPGTIEQRIDDILREKRELMSVILDQQDAPRQRGLSQAEIFSLFDLKKAA